MTAKRHRPIELIIDPSSGQLSMSRLCFGVLILDLQALLIASAFGIKFTMWPQFGIIMGAVAGAYGANSVVRVWRNGSGAVPGRVRPPIGE